MKTIHVAVVGAGSFGRHHVRHLASHPLVHRVSVVDRDGARAAEVAARHGASVAASAENADAAVVAVPTEAHAAVARPLLAAGMPVLIEKPIAFDNNEAATLLSLARSTGARLQVGHIERFSPVMQAINARAKAPRRITCRRHNTPRAVPVAVDVVLDLMIHDIDLVLTLAQAPVVAVSAMAEDLSGHEAATARLTFADGTVAHLSASRLAASVERTITLEDGDTRWHGDFVNLTLDETTTLTRRHVLRPHDNLGAEIDDFVQGVVTGSPATVDGEAGAEALAVANRIRAAVAASVKIPA